MVLHILAAAAVGASLGVSSPAANETNFTPPHEAQGGWSQVAYHTEDSRWRTPICVGVTGLSADRAQYVVDRVSQRAREVGLRVGDEGCRANALIVFSADPNGQASAIAAERSDPASTTGIQGVTEGRSAFASFLNSSDPVRWWKVSQPVIDTGQAAVRDQRNNIVPNVRVPERGRLNSTTQVAVSHAIVIVDLRQVNGYSLGALSDYLAMVTLAPIEGAGGASGSIMGLFADQAAGRTPASGLTEADRAHLRAAYP